MGELTQARIKDDNHEEYKIPNNDKHFCLLTNNHAMMEKRFKKYRITHLKRSMRYKHRDVIPEEEQEITIIFQHKCYLSERMWANIT